MVDVQTPSRNDQDTASARMYPTTQASTPAAAAPAASATPVDSFMAGTAQVADTASTISDVGHRETSCPACQQGQEGHYSFADRRADQEGVVSSRLVTGPNVQPVD
jgi:hypothetical protein